MSQPSFSVRYVLGFATAVCGVCAVFVAGSAVVLADRQSANQAIERQRNVLEAAGLSKVGERLTAEEIASRFARVEPQVIDLETGAPTDVDPKTFDQQKAKRDPAESREAPENEARVFRLPNQALVYAIKDESGALAKVVLPIEGYGLWSTLYGYLALGPDLETIEGITFYQHGETPGLGGEVDNPRWKALWPGRKAFDDDGEPAIEVIKGQAGPPSEAPHSIDGLSGATITSRGVTHLVQFWLGPNGFGPYLDRLRQGRTS